MENAEKWHGNIIPDDDGPSDYSPKQAALQNTERAFKSPSFKPSIYDMQQEAQRNKDSGLFPRFHKVLQQNMLKTNTEGRPMFDEVDYVEIRIAGDKNNIVNRKVTQEDRDRWPVQYAAFNAGEAETVTGTPIEEWPQLSRTMAATCKALHIMNVEALAALSDDGIQRLGMGARDLVEKAKAYLAFAKDQALPQRQAAEILKQKEVMISMQQQIDELAQLAKAFGSMQQQMAALQQESENNKMLIETSDAQRKLAQNALAVANQNLVSASQTIADLTEKVDKLSKPKKQAADKTS